MKILVIGGTGLIGGSLVERLLKAGHRITVLTRGKRPNRFLGNPEVTFVTGERRKESALRSILGRQTFDVVYDIAAFEPKESEAAVRVFRGRVGRFIHCSTISVYMVSNDVQCPITEDQDRAPLMEYWPRNPFGMDYGIAKRRCEDVLWQAHDERLFPVSMLRPTFVSGPNDPTKRDFFWIERILDGGPLLVPGSGDCVFQQVYVEDVAQAFVSLLDSPISIGKAYNVAAEEIFSLNEYLNALCRLLNRSPEIVHVDQNIFDRLPFSTSLQGDVFPFNTRRTTVFSLEKIKRDLNYRPTPFKEWMQVTIDWFTNTHRGRSIGYERRHEELAFTETWRRTQKKIAAEYSIY